MKFLFVVHRAAPYPGGSEVYVQAMAEEAKSRGHEVAILAGEHRGEYHGIRITNDANIMMLKWDLIIVHGFGPAVQNFVLQVAKDVPSPMLYMLILPSDHPDAVKAMNDCTYLGWSTREDLSHMRKHNVLNKAVEIRHGIDPQTCSGQPGFKVKHNITQRMFLSCGGYWDNKLMKELADVFVKANIDDAVLVTTGYDNRSNLMPAPVQNKVIPLMIDDRAEVLSAFLEANCYLMHSSLEGFGLVILESMLNRTPWIARRMAGPALLSHWGKTYTTDDELIHLLKNFNPSDFDLAAAEQHVLTNHLIANTINDIEAIVINK